MARRPLKTVTLNDAVFSATNQASAVMANWSQTIVNMEEFERVTGESIGTHLSLHPDQLCAMDALYRIREQSKVTDTLIVSVSTAWQDNQELLRLKAGDLVYNWNELHHGVRALMILYLRNAVLNHRAYIHTTLPKLTPAGITGICYAMGIETRRD